MAVMCDHNEHLLPLHVAGTTVKVEPNALRTEIGHSRSGLTNKHLLRGFTAVSSDFWQARRMLRIDLQNFYIINIEYKRESFELMKWVCGKMNIILRRPGGVSWVL